MINLSALRNIVNVIIRNRNALETALAVKRNAKIKVHSLKDRLHKLLENILIAQIPL